MTFSTGSLGFIIMFKKLFKRKEIVDPIFREGRLAFSNGVAVSDNPYRSTNTERAQVWESGWHEGQASRQDFEIKQKYGKTSLNASSGVLGIFAVMVTGTLIHTMRFGTQRQGDEVMHSKNQPNVHKT